MSARVLKWTVPVDDQSHRIGIGPVLHVACQTAAADSVQVWTLETSDPSEWKPVQVFGTGQELPREWAHIGSALTAGGIFVWHVFEAPPEQWGPAA